MPGITNDGIAELAKSLAKAQNLRSLKLALYEYKKNNKIIQYFFFARNKQLNNQTSKYLADALSNLVKLEEFELYM